MSRNDRRATAGVLFATVLVLLLNLIAMQMTDEVNWGVFDFVFAGVLLGGTGLLLVRASRSRDSVIPRAAAAAIGVAAIGLGQADDAPGLMLFGLLLVVGAAVLMLRTALDRNGW